MNIYEIYALKLVHFLLEKPNYQKNRFRLKTFRKFYNIKSSNRSAVQIISNLLIRLERVKYVKKEKDFWSVSKKFRKLLNRNQESIIFETIRWKV